MPARKSSKSTKQNNSSNWSQLKWGESYTSLFLGAVVVIVALVLVFSFLKDRTSQMLKETSSTQTKNEQSMTPKTYTVKSGEYLSEISEKVYGTPDHWVDIANANNLTDPSTIFSGNVLKIPEVKMVAGAQTQMDNSMSDKITGSSYTIKRGDDLWNIALRAYGDGYKWVDIAKANGYTNPDLINADNVLKLPR